MYGESPCTGNLIGDIWVTVTASTSRQEGKAGRVWWAQRRWADDLLFIDAQRGSETGTPGRATLRLLWKWFLVRAASKTQFVAGRVSGCPSCMMGMPQQQLLMRAWNTAHFSNSLLNFIFLFLGVLCFYREGMKWCCVSSTLKAASSHYFKLKDCQFRLDVKKVFFYNDGGKILA